MKMWPTTTTTTMMRELLVRLRGVKGIRGQVRWFLFVSRVYLPTKRQYERHYLNQCDDDHDDLNKSSSFKFPEYPRLLRMYNVLSNILITWVCLKFLAPDVLNTMNKLIYHQILHRWDSLEVGPSLHCYSFGRLVIHYDVSDEFLGCLLASYHVFWRLAQELLDRSFSLDVVLFLMQPREEIEQFISKLEATNESIERARRRRRLRGGHGAGTGGLFLSASQARGARSHPSTRWALNYSNLNQRERLLCDIMCFRVTCADLDEDGDKAGYLSGFEEPQIVFMFKLRPNRSLEAHERLINLLTETTIKGTLCLSFMAICFIVYLWHVIIFNQHRYFNIFPNCHLELANKSEPMDERWSWPHLTSHRLSAIIGDVIENAFVWAEGGLALVYALLFADYLNQDLIHHWLYLEKKICTLSLEAREIHYLFNETLNNFHFTGRILADFHQQVYELQAQLGDFYRQIQRVDLLVSDIITYALLVWLSAFGYLGYRSADLWSATHNAEFAYICLSISGLVFVGYTIVSISLLSLQRKCHSAYLNLCSLMAYDDSRHKKQFGLLIDYYTEKNRTCYTWFQQVPFSTTNFLSIIGWSFTGFLILDNVYNRL